MSIRCGDDWSSGMRLALVSYAKIKIAVEREGEWYRVFLPGPSLSGTILPVYARRVDGERWEVSDAGGLMGSLCCAGVEVTSRMRTELRSIARRFDLVLNGRGVIVGRCSRSMLPVYLWRVHSAVIAGTFYMCRSLEFRARDVVMAVHEKGLETSETEDRITDPVGDPVQPSETVQKLPETAHSVTMLASGCLIATDCNGVGYDGGAGGNRTHE